MTPALHEAMCNACRTLGVKPPRREPVPGRWTITDTEARNGKGDGRVLIFDRQDGGMVWNHQIGQSLRFTVANAADAPRRNPAAEALAKAAAARRERESKEAEALCQAILRDCRQDYHDYLRRKGFASELGLVHDNPRSLCPDTPQGREIAAAMPEGQMLIIPGRIGGKVTTLQFIAADGTKKNIKFGHMSGASHRIAQGRETWVCEGIATAMSVRAALRLLGRSATVLSAFAAANVAAVAKAIPGAIIAADHDKPQKTLGGLGAGEYFAVQSGCQWVMPPALGDWNDMHQAEGLRSVALALRGVGCG